MRSGGEEHLYNPLTIHLLQESTRTGDYSKFKEYTAQVNDQNTVRVRCVIFWHFKYPKKGIPIEEVESVDSIVTRFKTGAMSYGSISQEAHETSGNCHELLCMVNPTPVKAVKNLNRLIPGTDGKNRCSAIKQVASGRFGVTSQATLSVPRRSRSRWHRAQNRVRADICRAKKYIRGSQRPDIQPRVYALISPPPHHDIYSIEDLAQLIYDLKKCQSQMQEFLSNWYLRPVSVRSLPVLPKQVHRLS